MRISNESPSSSSSEEQVGSDTGSSDPPSTVGEDEYAATSFPGYSEKPLDEQLEPIAVVGMGCRLPGDVGSASEFWDMMMSRGTGQTPKVPASRFNIDAHIHKNKERPGSFGVLGGYFLNEDLANFDPGLFGITPVEAMWMDPQQRKLLEVVYESLESGGVSLDKISGTRTAVFAASFTADWQQMAFKEHSFRHNLAATGVDPGIISNRISHVFNLNGPSIMCNTACSSSVYALHNACNALRNGEAEGAIVGGVNLIITVDQHMNTAKLGVLSPTSTCHTFDASADGYGRADAVGAVYLKRLSDAVRDGDPIRGVIRSSATNSNGKVIGNGITHPGLQGQRDVINAAYKRGGDLDPRLTGYFECHGTGTAVGDPLEVNAVNMAMNRNRQPEDPALWIGAVKTNIGHSEAASGLSALIKAVLIVERGVIPATRGVENPSQAIKWDEWKVRVPTDSVPFPRHLPVRRVSLNSFGYGGTNAHLIVEGTASMARHAAAYAYLCKWAKGGQSQNHLTGRRRALERKRPYLLPFSAHDKATLRRNIDAHAKVAAGYSLLDLSFTLSTRRSVLGTKAYTVANHETLPEVFADVDRNFSLASGKKPARKIGFVFTGQGAQWARMGAELMTYSPRFLSVIRALDLVLEGLQDGPVWSIEDMLLEPAESSPISEAEFAQPLCTAVQIAIVHQLADWGIKPEVVVGHSSGEIAAAHAAGLVSAEDAIIAAYYRGVVARLVETQGSMLAVGLGAEQVQPYLDDAAGKVVVACHNSPALVTLSGDSDALEQVKERLDAQSVFNRVVATGGKAYHSHHMQAVAEKYRELVRTAVASRPKSVEFPAQTAINRAKMVSSVTTSILEPGSVDEKYWSDNLCSPVLFNQAVHSILTSDDFSEVDVLVEVGPHPAMAGPVKQIKAAAKAEKVEYIGTLQRKTDSANRMLTVAGELFLREYPVDMDAVSHAYVEAASASAQKPPRGAVIVDLPPYQWNYTRPFWAESRTSREQRQPKFPRHDVLGQRVIGGSLSEPVWRNVLRVRDLPWLRDHRLGGEAVFPAAGYFSMAVEAVRQVNEETGLGLTSSSYVLRDVSIDTALVTPENEDDEEAGIEVLFSLRPSSSGGPGWWDWSVSSVDGEGVVKSHMSGSIGADKKPRGSRAPREVPHLPQRATGRAWNRALRSVGFDYGKTFQDMDEVRFDGKTFQAACTTTIKQTVDDALGESRYILHPATIDSSLQLCIAAVHAGRTAAMACGVVPVKVDEVVIYPPTEAQLEKAKASAYASVHHRGQRMSESNVEVVADDGEVLMEITNMRAVAYEAAVPQKDDKALDPAPYGEMAWELDVDVPENRESLGQTDLVRLALFKYPELAVLETGGFSCSVQMLQDYPRASFTVAVSSDEELEAAKQAVVSYNAVKVVKYDPEAGFESSGLKPASFSLLIAHETEPTSSLDALKKPYSSVGYGVFVTGGAGAVDAKSKEDTISQRKSHRVELVYRNQPASVVGDVITYLERLGYHDLDVKSLLSLSGASETDEEQPKTTTIMLADLENQDGNQALLESITEKEFDALRDLLTRSPSIMWLSGNDHAETQPGQAMISGLARVVGAEQASLDMRILNVELVDGVIQDPTLVTKHVADILAQMGGTHESSSNNKEREFRLSGGKRYITRLVPSGALNRIYSPSHGTSTVKLSPGDRVEGHLHQGKLVFRRSERRGDDEDSLAKGHVEVRVLNSGLTKEGALAITGSDYSTIFSHEIGGVVSRVGPGAEPSGLEVGDMVVGFSFSHFGSYQQVPACLVRKVRNKTDMPATVSGLMAYASAMHGLETLAKLEEGETVLVLGSTGLAGSAAIRVALAKGAVPIVLTQSQEEPDFLMQTLGVPEDHILDAADPLVWGRVAALTRDGRGADVVFSAASSVSHDVAHEAWRQIAPFGRFVDSGRKTNLERNVVDHGPMRRGASYLPFDLVDLYHSRPDLLAEMLPRILDHSARRIAITTLHPVELSGLAEAASTFADHFGAPKPVVSYPDDDGEAADAVIPILPSRPRASFSPTSTYLLVGCLGGLGRSLTSWMMEHGARRFTFLSRSGTDAPSAALLVADLAQAGAHVQVVRGDATSVSDVSRAVEGVPHAHPIKGVVHAAMVLRDGLFHSMTYESWKQSTEPKIIGAQNLDAVLGASKLDFFVMTSSVSGVLGLPSQANYAAANNYLDALARSRRARGLTATSVVLPMVLGVGVVAENSGLESSLARKGMYGIDEEELLQAFQVAMSPAPVGLNNDTALPVPQNVVVGLDPSRLRDAVLGDGSGGDGEESNGDDAGGSGGAAPDAFWLEDPRFSHAAYAIRSSNTGDDGGSGGGSILATIRDESLSPEQVMGAVAQHFARKLARMLMLDPADVDPEAGASIASYGVDSMVGAELRSWIFREYRVDVPFQKLLGPSLTMGKFSALVCSSHGVGSSTE